MTQFYSLYDILKRYLRFVEPSTDCRYFCFRFYLLGVGAYCYISNGFNVFVCEKGKSVLHYHVLYKLFSEVLLGTTVTDVLFAVALIVGIPVVTVAISVHFCPTVTAKEFTR